MADRFAADEAEAERRYARYRDVDPFPEIEPALLNSADIGDYASVTGMVVPFIEDAEHLKAASYQVPLLGRYVYWDSQGQEVSDIIGQGDPFILKANSIAFVTLEPMFHVPNYIAIRFNLRITNIYRGILLGTGPLVDPGFVGRLSLPLHNLTINDYPFRGGEGLIWMEFTKISRHPQQHGSVGLRQPQRRGHLFSIQPYKADPTHDVRYYLSKAWPAGPIRSSITDATLEATRSAAEAAKGADHSRQEVERLRRLLTGIGGGALLTVILGAVAVVVMTFQLVSAVDGRVDQLSRDLTNLQSGAGPGIREPTTSGSLEEPSAMSEVVGRLDELAEAEQENRVRETIWLTSLTGAVVVGALGTFVAVRRTRRRVDSQ